MQLKDQIFLSAQGGIFLCTEDREFDLQQTHFPVSQSILDIKV